MGQYNNFNNFIKPKNINNKNFNFQIWSDLRVYRPENQPPVLHYFAKSSVQKFSLGVLNFIEVINNFIFNILSQAM